MPNTQHIKADNSAALCLTYREAAQLLKCCERVVWGLVQSGEIRAIRLGRAVRIPRSEIERFIESRLNRPAHP